jgi:hypothetical protein
MFEGWCNDDKGIYKNAAPKYPDSSLQPTHNEPSQPNLVGVEMHCRGRVWIERTSTFIFYLVP